MGILSNNINKLSEVKKLKDVAAVSERREKVLAELKASGHYPAILKVAEKFILGDTGNDVLTLTEKTKEGDIEKKLCVTDVVINLLNAIPDDGKFEEKTEVTKVKQIRPNQTFEDDDDMEVDEIEKYAKEHTEGDYAKALEELNIAGKIKVKTNFSK